MNYYFPVYQSVVLVFAFVVWVLLDMDPSVQTGEGQNSTEEHGVILAASLVNRGLKMGKPVGLISYGDKLAWHPPATGNSNLWSIIKR